MADVELSDPERMKQALIDILKSSNVTFKDFEHCQSCINNLEFWKMMYQHTRDLAAYGLGIKLPSVTTNDNGTKVGH